MLAAERLHKLCELVAIIELALVLGEIDFFGFEITNIEFKKLVPGCSQVLRNGGQIQLGRLFAFRSS